MSDTHKSDFNKLREILQKSQFSIKGDKLSIYLEDGDKYSAVHYKLKYKKGDTFWSDGVGYVVPSTREKLLKKGG